MSRTDMPRRHLLLPILAVALLSACGKHEPPADPAAAPAPTKRAFVSTVPHALEVEVAVGGQETQQPLPLSDGASAEGQLVTTSAGDVVGIAVMVGNYFDSATGPLDVEVCISDRCGRGTVDTATSIDNEMLELPLAVPVTASVGDTVTYTFSRPAGANPIALWTYEALTATDHLLAPGDPARTPKVRLLLD